MNQSLSELIDRARGGPASDDEPLVAITVRFPVSFADQLGRASLAMGTTRAGLVRDLTMAGFDAFVAAIGAQAWSRLSGIDPEVEPIREHLHDQEDEEEALEAMARGGL